MSHAAPPPLTRCPQCSSLYCGHTVCRFSGLSHARAAELERQNAYAEAMTRRDLERAPRPEHDVDTAGRALRPGS